MITLAPKTLTREEVERLIDASKSCPRDNLIIRIALGTSLRVAEIAALDVGQVYRDGKVISRTQVLVKGGRTEDVMLPTKLQRAIGDFIAWKLEHREPISPGAPLFLSKRKVRLSVRRIQSMFQELQDRAGFARSVNFHMLRHTAGTNYLELNNDLLGAQRFMRHRRVETTMIYMHPSDERMRQQLESLPC